MAHRSSVLGFGPVRTMRNHVCTSSTFPLTHCSSLLAYGHAIKYNQGESKPVSGTVDSTDDNYLETHCIGMQGTHCISGTGMGVVVATGDKTVFGRIAKLTSQPSTGSTTLEKEILNFVIIIVSLMLFMIVLVIILWYDSVFSSLWE